MRPEITAKTAAVLEFGVDINAQDRMEAMALWEALWRRGLTRIVVVEQSEVVA
jgi:hypothetical protein